MPRWKLTLEYDGGPFVGWQRQETGPSIQAALEDAVAALTGQPGSVYGAGRTDSGVHALHQVAHTDIERDFSAQQIRDALNYHLKPNPIAVLAAEPVAPDFHARFSATGRAYLYRILNRRARPTLDLGRVWHNHHRLDGDAMHQAAQLLVGRHDFTSFRSIQCQSDSALKTLDRLDVRRAGDEIHIDVAARSFLHNQVRILVGTLELVGRGKWRIADVAEALRACDRAAAGPTAPPEGLYLAAVTYDPQENG